MKFGLVEVIDRSVGNQKIVNGDDLFTDHSFVTLASNPIARAMVAAGKTTRNWEASRAARLNRTLHGQVFEDRLTLERSENLTTKNFQKISVFTLIVTGCGVGVKLCAVNTT